MELPGEGVELDRLVVSEDLEFFEFFKADAVIDSLEVTVLDVALFPGPFLFDFVLFFDLEEEVLDIPFEAPKGRTAEHVVVSLPSGDEVEEAEGVEGGMVPTEVGSVLFMALANMDIIVGVVLMRDELGEGLLWDLE